MIINHNMSAMFAQRQGGVNELHLAKTSKNFPVRKESTVQVMMLQVWQYPKRCEVRSEV